MSINLIGIDACAAIAKWAVINIPGTTSAINIANILNAANTLSFNARYNESYQITLATADDIDKAPLLTDTACFFELRHLAINCYEYEPFANGESDGYQLIQQLMRAAICPSCQHGSQGNIRPVGFGYSEHNLQFGYIIDSRRKDGGECFMIGGSLQPLPGTEYRMCVIDVLNDTFTSKWVASEFVYQDKTDTFYPAITIQQAERIAHRFDKAHNRHLARQRAESERKAIEREQFNMLAAKVMPENATSYIVAELVQDESDSMSDYHGSSVTQRIILAFCKHNRNLFSEMRKAAKQDERTAFMADLPKDCEHRENYSMGGGYFLKDGYYDSDGWRIKKRRCDAVSDLPASAEFAPALVASSDINESADSVNAPCQYKGMLFSIEAGQLFH